MGHFAFFVYRSLARPSIGFSMRPTKHRLIFKQVTLHISLLFCCSFRRLAVVVSHARQATSPRSVSPIRV